MRAQSVSLDILAVGTSVYHVLTMLQLYWDLGQGVARISKRVVSGKAQGHVKVRFLQLY